MKIITLVLLVVMSSLSYADNNEIDKVFVKARYILGAAIHANSKKYTDDRYKGKKNFLRMTKKLRADAIALSKESESLPKEIGGHLTAAINFTAACVSTYSSYDSCTTAKGFLKETYWDRTLGEAVHEWSGRDRHGDWEGFPVPMK